MSKPKAEAGDVAMNKELSLVVELRGQIKATAAALDRANDRLGDTASQVRHLEKTNAALKDENDALHRELRNAQCARSHAEGRAEALEAFTPEVMVPRNRFSRPLPPSRDQYGLAPETHWFEGR